MCFKGSKLKKWGSVAGVRSECIIFTKFQFLMLPTTRTVLHKMKFIHSRQFHVGKGGELEYTFGLTMLCVYLLASFIWQRCSANSSSNVIAMTKTKADRHFGSLSAVHTAETHLIAKSIFIFIFSHTVAHIQLAFLEFFYYVYIDIDI